MKKEQFIQTLINKGLLIKERQEEEKKEEIKKQLKDKQQRQATKKTTRTTTSKIKKSLKELYKPIFCYNIYDAQKNDVLITQFNNLNDLLNYINKYENRSITLFRLKHIIKEEYLINDRYYIIKDKFIKNDFIEDIEKGLQYEN